MTTLHQPSVFMMAVNLWFLVEGHYESPASLILKTLLKTSKHGDTCRVSQLHRHTKDMLQICDIEKYRFLKFTMTFSLLVQSRGKV